MALIDNITSKFMMIDEELLFAIWMSNFTIRGSLYVEAKDAQRTHRRERLSVQCASKLVHLYVYKRKPILTIMCQNFNVNFYKGIKCISYCKC